MMVHRNKHAGRHEQFVLQAVSEQLGRFLYPVHRLDRQTSGVMAFALTKEAARTFQETLGTADTVKSYLALARGETPESFVSERPLNNARKEKQPARTAFERLATFSRCSLLEARITTGRRHQIRRHLGHLAHQIIGDSEYGKGRINQWFRDNHGLPRMFLHARLLVTMHPRTGDRIEFHDPLADDLREFLSRLPDVEATLIDTL